MVSVLPEENDLAEEERSETFCPDFAGKLLVIHIETTEVGVLEVGPGTTNVATEELSPAEKSLALACVIKRRELIGGYWGLVEKCGTVRKEGGGDAAFGVGGTEKLSKGDKKVSPPDGVFGTEK